MDSTRQSLHIVDINPHNVGNVWSGADGQLYEWIEGSDDLGNPIGFWRTPPRQGRQSGRRYVPPSQSSQKQSGAKSVSRKSWRTPRWYKPWIKDFTLSPGDRVLQTNMEPGTLRSFDTGWTRDALTTGMLSAAGGLATTILAKRLNLPQLLQYIAGGSSAFYRSYKGYQVQERLWGRTAQAHAVYGRYRVDLSTNKIIAAYFRGRGPSSKTYIKPIYYQQRIVDADNNVIYTHSRHDFSSLPPFSAGDFIPPQWPEKSFGNFAK